MVSRWSDDSIDMVASYVSGRGTVSAEEIASSLELDVREVRCALRELERDGLLDSDEDDY